MSDNDHFNDERTLYSGDPYASGGRDLPPGHVVGGSYRIKKVLGRGGMGVVYAAEHLIIKRECALKALASDLINESNWRRFQTEGRAISRLDHSNIVKVYDMGTDGPHFIYYAMELLQGISLAEAIQLRRYLSVADTLGIFRQLCSGLGYAHEYGVVHRDIKPSNVFLCPDKNNKDGVLVKIIDFGIAKLIGDPGQLQQSQTATGQVFGSPVYMSPEQFTGGAVDKRSDIYSLGCALFESLTGAPPFKGASVLDTAFLHQNDAPPRLEDFRPSQEFPENLEQLVSRMLEKNPAQRYQSMEQVARDIARVTEGKTVGRAAIHLQESAYPFVDEKAEEAFLQARYSRKMFVCFLAVIFLLGAVGATISFFHAPVKKTVYSALVPKRVLSAEEERVQALYAKWPQISHGVSEKEGIGVRVFNFPDVPLGFISWSGASPGRVLAKGGISVPAGVAVKLELPRPEGLYARLFPEILAKIGPDDIDSLAVQEPREQGGESLLLSDVSPELIKALAGWKALRVLDFYHCTLKKEAVLALNQVRPVDQLLVHNAVVDGADLAQVKWLKNLICVDAKHCVHVDKLLYQLAGSTRLQALVLDATEPSAAGLAALATCPNLVNLSLDETGIDVTRARSLGQIKSLRTLSLKKLLLSAQSVRQLAPLTRLRTLRIVTHMAGVQEALRETLPNCSVVEQPLPKYGVFTIIP